MKQPSEDHLEVLHSLFQLLLEKVLDEQFLSRDSMIQIIHPVQKEDWEIKALYAKKLIEILNTSKTEEEILKRASDMSGVDL